MACSYGEARALLSHGTGVVVPIYIPPRLDSALAVPIVEDTVAGLCGLVGDPARVCLSIDGPGRGAEIGGCLGRSYGATVYTSTANRGKLEAARCGARVLLERAEVEYLAIVDQDGDHFPNELTNLIRAAAHAREVGETDNVLVLGCRSSRHRPMGFLRGEHEELADQMLLRALHYHAAVTNEPLRLEFASSLVEVPDFHSGYKLFSRTCAAAGLMSAPQLAGLSADCYYRHAVEAVMVVESVVHGATMVAVSRSTLDAQPISAFGEYERCRLVADMIIWPCRRLQVPAAFAEQWLLNCRPALKLSTLVPQGQEDLDAIAGMVLAAYDREPRADDSRRPLFV